MILSISAPSGCLEKQSESYNTLKVNGNANAFALAQNTPSGRSNNDCNTLPKAAQGHLSNFCV
ncbi:hypothetical protein AB4254_11645 [Vibrio breoganii]